MKNSLIKMVTKMDNKKQYISLILKIAIIISSILGVILSILKQNDQFMGGVSTLLFFTIQSNLWICIVMIMYIATKIQKKELKSSIYIVKYIFTISISLTGVVYCFLLAPVMPKDYNAWSLPSVLTHVIVPACSIIDMFIDNGNMIIKHKHTLLVLIPPLYYLIFAIVGFFLNFDYGHGQNYPYFFLNFGCEAGLFGFVKEPLEIGCFYWILLMLIIVLGTGYLYRLVINKQNMKGN